MTFRWQAKLSLAPFPRHTQSRIFARNLPSLQGEVTKTVQAVQSWLCDHRVGPDHIDNIALVLAEALNNVIEHAFVYAEDGQISLKIWIDTDAVCFTLVDDGAAMAGIPAKQEMSTHVVALEDLPEGGFGWFLIHSLSNNLLYERKGAQNELTVSVPALT